MLENGLYHAERRYNGKNIIIDTCYEFGTYETMVLYANGTEIESKTTRDINQAKKHFFDYCDKYPETTDPLKGKYAKLRDDLKEIYSSRETLDAIYNSADGGSCNFDSPILYLPRWNSKKVRQAAKEAGLDCSVSVSYGVKRYILSCSFGMGDRRTTAAEIIANALKGRGYDTSVFYMMD